MQVAALPIAPLHSAAPKAIRCPHVADHVDTWSSRGQDNRLRWSLLRRFHGKPPSKINMETAQ